MFFKTALLYFLTATLSFAATPAADTIPVTIPLPHMPHSSTICGTMFIPFLIDFDDFQNNHRKQETHQIQIIPGNDNDPEVGDRRNFYVVNFEKSNNTTEFDEIEFELRAISDKSEIWVEVEELGDEKISDEVVTDILQEQDEQTSGHSWNPGLGIIDIGRQLFGDPPDFDGSGRLKTLLVNIQDGWDPEEGGGYIGGFFNPIDQVRIHPNSNKADIIYINTYPGIYRENRDPDASRVFGTLAHEYQHLIHHSYGNLNVFQNEGQSEFAEVISGYGARSMRWLERPEEIDGTVSAGSGPEGLYRWRRNSSDVLLDYQRAQLLHSYIYERTGAELAGSITRAASGGKNAYLEALEPSGLSWEEFLRDFQITNRVNNPDIGDGSYAYTLPQMANVRATGNNAHYNLSWDSNLAGLTLSEGTSSADVMYGGGYYSLFEQPVNLSLDLNGDEHTTWAAILIDLAGSDVILLSSGPAEIDGAYDEIVLVGANTREEGGSEESPGSRRYTYSFEYEVVDISSGYDDLPGDFRLYGAYPNPFNPAAQIRYSVPAAAHVTLTVYNVLGQRVAMLVNGEKGPGSHDVTFDASGLSGGVYLYRLRAELGTATHTASGKMLLVK